MFASCTKKSETTAAITADSYEKILEGDLSAFTGTWVNSRGERRQLMANGIFNAGETAYGFKIGNENDQYIAGTNYQWIVNIGGEAGGFEVWLYPAGTAIRNYDGDFIEMDNTKVRIVIESIGSNDDVYYREGELPNSDAKLLDSDLSAFAGTWVNNAGGTYTIPQPQSWENEFPGGFKQFDNYYTWWHPAGDFGIYLVPVGIDLILHGNVIPTDKTKIRLVTEDLHSAPVVYYHEGEASAQLEHEELRIGSSVSGYVSGDAIDHYNIRSSEAGELILQIESNVEIWLEVYQGDRFILESTTKLGEHLTRVAFLAQPNTVYHLQVRSYVRDVVWEAYRITASFSRLAG